jgi:hypothetical protein
MVAIALTRLWTLSTWAETHPRPAAAIFAWIVLDTLFLALLARAPRHRPSLFQVAGVGALASIVIIAGAAVPVRDVYLELEAVLVAAGGTLAIFTAWSFFRIIRGWREQGSFAAGLERVLPQPLAGFIIAEGRMIALALLRWRARADVPPLSLGFAYHAYLTPVLAVFIALQVVELGVVHLLLMIYFPKLAWVLLALSVWGVIWTVALLKSFRIHPVLLTGDAVRVRAGMLYDFAVRFDRIAAVNGDMAGKSLDDRGTLNLAFLSSPNVVLHLHRPVAVVGPLGGRREITIIAMRLDDSPAFLAELRSRL